MTSAASFSAHAVRIVLAAAALTTQPGTRLEAASASVQQATFSEYTPLASSRELARRTMTPFDAVLKNAPDGQQLINLKAESFIVRIPTSRPPSGFGVLVFVPPWDDGRLPDGWGATLDRLGFIFVAATRSGNEQGIFDRREPLAVLAAHNIAKLYPVDPNRVFIGGFSGGSRVAMRLALAYPDLFRGALLDAGSDPIGTRDAPLPPLELFDRFRRSSRLTYVTGAQDEASLQLDGESIASMRRWCVPNVSARQVPSLGHVPVGGSTLSLALEDLMRPPGESASSNACWSRAQSELDASLGRVTELLRSNPSAARDLLIKIDHQFGGLAAPRLLTLVSQLGAARR